MIRKSLPVLAAALLLGSFVRVSAQSETPPTALQRQLNRIDFGVLGVGEFNTTVNGTVYPLAANTGQAMTQYGSNTLGALVTIRYIARPYIGVELNYGYARYTENYTGPAIANAIGSSDFQIQTQANEYTLGYLVTPPHPVFGLQPFASAGSGSIEFKPTAHGGEGAPKQARQVYYYNLGVQKDYFSNHVGLRAGFRELFFIDPDYGQNYLTIKRHASTYEPAVGFYLRF